VIVENVALEAKLLSRTLRDVGYSQVTCCTDVDGALTEIDKGARLVIADIDLERASGVELTKRLRARTSSDGYVYVVLVTAHGASRLEHAFAAGADDFVTKPFRPEELIARLRAAERVLDLEGLLRARARELETALRRIDVAAASRALERAAASLVESDALDASRPLESLARGGAWSGLVGTVASSLEAFLGLEHAPTTERVLKGSPYTAEVLLTEAALELEIAITVAADDSTINALAEHVLGESDREGGEALVLETANVVMGAVKTACTQGGFMFTGGLPAATEYSAASATMEATPIRRRMTFASTAGALEVSARARQTKSVSVRARDLKEGMVVGADVHDARGMLLIRAGSRLTETTTERLARLAPDLMIVVSNASSARKAA